jgi:hypothetical protein
MSAKIHFDTPPGYQVRWPHADSPGGRRPGRHRRGGVRIGDHRGAVETAQAEFDNGVNTGAVTMAHNIVTTQQAEMIR